MVQQQVINFTVFIVPAILAPDHPDKFAFHGVCALLTQHDFRRVKPDVFQQLSAYSAKGHVFNPLN